MNRLLAAALVGALSITACAADQSGDARATPAAASAAEGDAAVRQALETLVPNVKIDSIKPSPIAGFREVVLSGQVLYVSEDGKYLIQGTLFDIATRTDLTEATRAGIRREALAKVGPEQRIVFAPAERKHTVTVFTDIDCGYCRRLHQQMKEYNELGIAVEYLFFPRAGIGSESFQKAVSVWCADDRHQAMTEAKNGIEIPRRECDNPVASDFALGQQVGVDGTPAIYTGEGIYIGGYLAPQQMLQRLEQLAARQAAR
ncbi:disulfide isomerase DsbC N-terminal domain-containing protein [Rehaibacterium terrae]|jgi:thiol:disulfide interchange protein DsbC|uniref:Thiol:disulfide interchange protein n=1 Tax=Rehaibacterium terrae TaxID=1341696 RepID=A0A7W7XX96_9GAMM|nr:disulfide isomerase DsbC N-terminal domain-containing protein [Rehaibacterium terrae]MBB5014498.1 thiol:disulfide interchange protein DsbC [Rehaibacterium terrae]